MQTTTGTQGSQAAQLKNISRLTEDIKPVEYEKIGPMAIQLDTDCFYFKGEAIEYFQDFGALSMDEREQALKKTLEIQTIIDRMIKEVSEVALRYPSHDLSR